MIRSLNFMCVEGTPDLCGNNCTKPTIYGLTGLACVLNTFKTNKLSWESIFGGPTVFFSSLCTQLN